MFAFIKKLFNIEKTDTNNLVERKQQVEFQSNNGHSKLEDVKIKDSNLNNVCETNENYKDNKLNFCNCFSDVIASTSSRIKDSFDNTLDTIYKNQRRSSKSVAIKKIQNLAKELSSRSYENDKVVAQNRLYMKTVRLCHKCKTLKTFFGDVSTAKNCDECGSRLLYFCTICRQKHYASYKGLRLHKNLCNGNYISQELVDNNNQHECPACYMKIFNEKTMRYQDIKQSKNLKFKDKIITEDSLVIVDNITQTNKLATSNKSKTRSLSKWMQRYCEKCKKIVKLKGVSKRRPKLKCKTCRAALRYRCIKCHVKYISNCGINYHLKSKCLSAVIFQCDMCSYQCQFKGNLKRHIEGIHLQKKNYCQYCSFETIYESSLKKHQQRFHSSQ